MGTNTQTNTVCQMDEHELHIRLCHLQMHVTTKAYCVYMSHKTYSDSTESKNQQQQCVNKIRKNLCTEQMFLTLPGARTESINTIRPPQLLQHRNIYKIISVNLLHSTTLSPDKLQQQKQQDNITKYLTIHYKSSHYTYISLKYNSLFMDIT